MRKPASFSQNGKVRNFLGNVAVGFKADNMHYWFIFAENYQLWVGIERNHFTRISE